MNTDTMPRPKVHHGRNIKNLREILGIKQETIAIELDLTQQAISKLETKEIIDDETLNRVAEILKVPIEAIKNMSDDLGVNIIANTFNNDSALNAHVTNFRCTFNPIDKIVELYERLLAEKDKSK